MVVVASDEVEVTDLVLQRGQCLLGFLWAQMDLEPPSKRKKQQKKMFSFYKRKRRKFIFELYEKKLKASHKKQWLFL